MRKTFILITVAVSLLFSIPVHASQYSEVIGGVMDLIENKYVGREISEEELYEAALIGISLALDDYSGYMSEESLDDFTNEYVGRPVGIGIVMRQTETGGIEISHVTADSPAEKAGLMRGDFLISINGVSTEGLMLSEISSLIAESEEDTALVEYSRGGVKTTVEIAKEELKSHTVYIDTIKNMTGEPAEDVGYINLSSFGGTTAEDLRAAIDRVRAEGITKLILDMRLNGGGRLDIADEICNMLVPAGPTYHIVDRDGQRLTETSDLKVLPFASVVVLVDKYTASAAELLAAALQDSKMRVVGETTYGKGVVQTLFSLPTGGAFKLTTQEYFRRSGKKVNGIGVIPDFAVASEPLDYNTPKDLMLLKAVELLSE